MEHDHLGRMGDDFGLLAPVRTKIAQTLKLPHSQSQGLGRNDEGIQASINARANHETAIISEEGQFEIAHVERSAQIHAELVKVIETYEEKGAELV